MAALSEKDLRLIHGDNYQAALAPETEQDKRRDARVTAREAIDTWSDRNFTFFAVFFLGCALMYSCLYAQSQTALQIQAALAGVLMICGLGGIFYGRSRLKELRTTLANAAEPV